MGSLESDIFRIDPLTECHNFLSYVEALDDLSRQEIRPEFSIVYLDMNGLSVLNTAKGYQFGDSAIRWMGIALKEVTHSVVYRIDNDDFAVILLSGSMEEHLRITHNFIERMEREAGLFGMPSPAAGMVIIHYEANKIVNPVGMFMHMGQCMLEIKKQRTKILEIVESRNLPAYNQFQEKNWRDATSIHDLEYLTRLALSRIISLGRELDEAKKLAYTDAITDLPNMRAAQNYLESISEDAKKSEKPYSILLIDGDDLRVYNNINYAAGDNMLRDLSSVIKRNVRPDDFVARWRSGDEFIAVLPSADLEGAGQVAGRLCDAVKVESMAWKFPITISIGVASFPAHCDNQNLLLEKAEKALKQAKDEGKDRAVMAD